MKDIIVGYVAATDNALRITEGAVVLTRRACELMHLCDALPYVRFRQQDGKVYICSSLRPGYRTCRIKGRKARTINSRTLSRTLADLLGGFATYAIKDHDTIFVDGAVHYPITSLGQNRLCNSKV